MKNSKKIERIKQEMKLNDYGAKTFVEEANRWVKALEQGRLLCIVKSVSQSGASRVLQYVSCEKRKWGWQYCHYHMFFHNLGLKPKLGEIRVRGGGIDMTFATVYDISRTLKELGVITEAKREKLVKLTPPCF